MWRLTSIWRQPGRSVLENAKRHITYDTLVGGLKLQRLTGGDIQRRQRLLGWRQRLSLLQKKNADSDKKPIH